MKAHDNDDRSARMGDQIHQGEASSWGPVGPDGAPRPDLLHTAQRPRAREWSAEHVPCLRNCRYLMEAVSHFDHGNAPGSLGVEPLMRHVYCSAMPGVFLELSADSPVYECSRWDPEDPSEAYAREQRRRLYFDMHPSMHENIVCGTLPRDRAKTAGPDDLDKIEDEILTAMNQEDPQNG